MSSAERSSESAAGAPAVNAGEFRLEVVVLPVSDVDRAKEFYGGLGWRLDADVARGISLRLVQFTPPGSACSIQFGTNIASGAPGSAQRAGEPGGHDSVAFSGRIGHSPLPAGAYTAVLSASNSAGSSKPAMLAFTITHR